MDLKLEKAWLAQHFGAAPGEADGFHFERAPAAGKVDGFCRQSNRLEPSPRMAAQIGAVHHVATCTALRPVGMAIGPFSLVTKLMSDPITAVFLAGSGVGADDDPEVALLEACLRLSEASIHRYIDLQIAAGAKAIFIAEPAANKVYVSPNQMAQGSDVFERFVVRPNLAIAARLADAGVDLIFHCCGEIDAAILGHFCSLRPAMLSLGSSRVLPDDAARVPKDIVLYGNLPSKRFVSAQLTTAQVGEMAVSLVRSMRRVGHPFILGTECDTLFVPGCGDQLREKVARIVDAAAG
jgi:uroporphyrinogen-III decarboxylase